MVAPFSFATPDNSGPQVVDRLAATCRAERPARGFVQAWSIGVTYYGFSVPQATEMMRGVPVTPTLLVQVSDFQDERPTQVDVRLSAPGKESLARDVMAELLQDRVNSLGQRLQREMGGQELG